MDKKLQFYLRRLHGLTGIFPLGYFILFHLKEGSSFSSEGFLYSLMLLWLPLIYHSLYGLYIVYEGGMNICCYRYLRNVMYFLQRWTGLFIIPILIYHIYTMKFGSFGNGVADNFILFFLVVISIFHLSNGIFGFLVDFGIAAGDKAQRVAVILSFVVFISLGLWGMVKFYQLIGLG